MTKSLIIAPFIPISDRLSSHRGAQGYIYADLIQSYHCEDITVIDTQKSKTVDYNDYDRMYVYHGNDRPEDSKSLNLFGGLEEFPYPWNVKKMSQFKGEIYSLAYDFPNYHKMLSRKFELNKDIDSILPDFKNVDFGNLLSMQKRSVTLNPFNPNWTGYVVGDSHAICMYRRGYNVKSIPFKTLHGILKEGLDQFVIPNLSHIEFYFGNIDVRHHLCRQDDTKSAIRTLVGNYVEQVKALPVERKTIYELLPIENESRKIPKSGWYKETPFYGSWHQRNDARLFFKEYAMNLTTNTDIEFREWIPKSFYNAAGELSFDVMEKPGSVHLSREYYPYWQGNEKKLSLESFFS